MSLWTWSRKWSRKQVLKHTNHESKMDESDQVEIKNSGSKKIAKTKLTGGWWRDLLVFH